MEPVKELDWATVPDRDRGSNAERGMDRATDRAEEWGAEQDRLRDAAG